MQQEEKQKYWVNRRTINFVQLVNQLQISHLNCPKCERRTVKLLRGKWTGDFAAVSVIDSSFCLSNPATLSLSCLQHSSCRQQPPPRLANSVLRELSVKIPTWPRPACFPLAVHQPPASPWDQTARLGPWLRLSIGSYGNGRLSPYCLIG